MCVVEEMTMTIQPSPKKGQKMKEKENETLLQPQAAMPASPLWHVMSHQPLIIERNKQHNEE